MKRQMELMRLVWVAAFMLTGFGVQAGVVFTVLHSFQAFPNGANPQAPLVPSSDGSFYGTTYNGGPDGGAGTVFRVSTNGVLTNLYSFVGGTDGAYPNGLVQGNDGFLYGTTYSGGAHTNQNGYGQGTVFKISTNGALTHLYSFTGGDDGAYPNGLVQGSDGYFYGTTGGGGETNLNGASGYGTVFKISTNGTLNHLYSFTNGNDGAYPSAGLVQGSDGYFYGTTSRGGTNDFGTVFKINANGALITLHSFTGTNDGAYPYSGLVQGSDGNFYGTTAANVANNDGTVFKISTNGTLTTLYSFTGGNDGSNPHFGLVQGRDGNLYGTTEYGGTNGVGTAFKVSTNGVLTTLHVFTGGLDGASPSASLVQGSDGLFYGTTYSGGTGVGGTVFKISANGVLTSLFSFTFGTDGGSPQAGLVQGSDGSFYGTTSRGGTNDFGTVFKINANGVLTNLYSFSGTNDGAYPQAGLVQGSDGNFYGTTPSGGTNGVGTVFKISANGALTSLYSLNGTDDGADPHAGLVQGSDGYFYGTTSVGGTNGDGTIFKVSARGAFTSLYSFAGTNDGGNPQAGLVQGSDGNFYGTTGEGGGTNGSGTVFKISADGEFTNLYSFHGAAVLAVGRPLPGNDGANPRAGLVQGSEGNLYGTTYLGGAYSRGCDNCAFTFTYGTVFKISTNGKESILNSFDDLGSVPAILMGVDPEAGLVQGKDGNLYGTTAYGASPFGLRWGFEGPGAVFRLSTNGVPSPVLILGGTAGANPLAGLVQGRDGSFYGTTSQGGQGGAGTVFRLAIVPEVQAAVLTNGALSLTWSPGAGGTSYQLQYNSDLSSSNWINLGNAITAAGAMLRVPDSVTNGPQRFYRVVLSP